MKRIIGIAVIVALVFALAACAAKEDATAEEPEAGTKPGAQACSAVLSPRT